MAMHELVTDERLIEAAKPQIPVSLNVEEQCAIARELLIRRSVQAGEWYGATEQRLIRQNMISR